MRNDFQVISLVLIIKPLVNVMVRLHVFPLKCNAMRACLRTIAFTLGGAPLVLAEVGGGW